MLGFLSHIWNAIRDLPFLILDGLVAVLNAIIAAIGAALGALMSLLPDMPGQPSAPSGGVLQWINWFVPLGPMLTIFALFVTCWLGFLIVRIGLRWFRAL